MVFIILYLVGGLLFVNGLLLLGIITNYPGVAAFNFLGGVLITFMALYIASTDMYKAFGETVSNTVAATCLTFSIAYLMIALEIWTKGDFTVLGFYCIPMAVCLFFIFLGFFNIIGKKLPKVPQFGILWLAWAICFLLFFLRFGLQVTEISRFTGWFIIIVGFITCSYPALANFQAGKAGNW